MVIFTLLKTNRMRYSGINNGIYKEIESMIETNDDAIDYGDEKWDWAPRVWKGTRRIQTPLTNFDFRGRGGYWGQEDPKLYRKIDFDRPESSALTAKGSYDHENPKKARISKPPTLPSNDAENEEEEEEEEPVSSGFPVRFRLPGEEDEDSSEESDEDNESKNQTDQNDSDEEEQSHGKGDNAKVGTDVSSKVKSSQRAKNKSDKHSTKTSDKSTRHKQRTENVEYVRKKRDTKNTLNTGRRRVSDVDIGCCGVGHLVSQPPKFDPNMLTDISESGYTTVDEEYTQESDASYVSKQKKDKNDDTDLLSYETAESSSSESSISNPSGDSETSSPQDYSEPDYEESESSSSSSSESVPHLDDQSGYKVPMPKIKLTTYRRVPAPPHINFSNIDNNNYFKAFIDAERRRNSRMYPPYFRYMDTDEEQSITYVGSGRFNKMMEDERRANAVELVDDVREERKPIKIFLKNGRVIGYSEADADKGNRGD